jgi:hypothetical protein
LLHGFRGQIYNEEGPLSSVLKFFYFSGCQIDAKITLTNQGLIVNFIKGISQKFGTRGTKQNISTEVASMLSYVVRVVVNWHAAILVTQKSQKLWPAAAATSTNVRPQNTQNHLKIFK